jgi:hypothetical protein
MFANLVWNLVATANSIVLVMSVKKLLSVILEYYLLYFVFWRTISGAAAVHKIFMSIVSALIFCSAVGTLEIYCGFAPLSYFAAGVAHHFGTSVGTLDREVRIQSTYPHPILYGAALATGITLALYLLRVVSTNAQRLFLWFGLMLMFLNLYKTTSRGPWLDAMLGCLLLLLFGTRRVRKDILCIAALCGALLIVRPGVWSTITGVYENTFSTGNATGSSYAYRYALQHAAVEHLLNGATMRAVWGYGPESFFDIHLEGMLLDQPHVFLSCDNAWVEFLMETGFVGLTIVAILLLKPVHAALRQWWKRRGTGQYLGLILLINFILIYLQMYSVGMYSWGQNGYILWILIAITFKSSTFVGSEPINRRAAASRRRWNESVSVCEAEPC